MGSRRKAPQTWKLSVAFEPGGSEGGEGGGGRGRDGGGDGVATAGGRPAVDSDPGLTYPFRYRLGIPNSATLQSSPRWTKVELRPQKGSASLISTTAPG